MQTGLRDQLGRPNRAGCHPMTPTPARTHGWEPRLQVYVAPRPISPMPRRGFCPGPRNQKVGSSEA